MLMKDNYGQDIPKLYLIGHLIFADLSDEEIKRVADADWYIVLIDDDGEDMAEYLMANADQLEPFDSECFIHVDGTVSADLSDGVLQEVLAVNDVLKRWSIQDNFYTA